MDLLSDCYYWLGCWWKPIWCCPGRKHVRAASFTDLTAMFKWLIVCSLIKTSFCAQSASTLHYCCCSWWKEPSLPDIWEDGWNYTHSFFILLKNVQYLTQRLSCCRLNCQVECSSCCLVSCPCSLDQKENCNPCLKPFSAGWLTNLSHRRPILFQ